MLGGTEILIGALAAVSVSLLVWLIARSAGEITYVTLADGRRAERRLPMLYRWLLPFVPNVSRLATRPSLDPASRRVQRALTSAGLDGVLAAREFFAIRILLAGVAAPLFLVFLRLALNLLPPPLGPALQPRFFALAAVFWIVALAQPGAWLRSRLRQRHRQIERALPFALDLLTLSVEAGLDFMSAIKRLTDRRRLDALNEEFIHMFREVQLGKTRRDALRDMAERINQPDARTVSNALVQADELGVSIAAILRIQSDQMRARRFMNAEKAANEAPVRILAPLVLFIFPAVLLVLLGPVLLQIFRHGF